MAINEVTNYGALPSAGGGKKAKEPARSPEEKKDKVELSSEAKSLFEAGQNKRVEEIRQKIRENFYFQPEVTDRVAGALLKDITK